MAQSKQIGNRANPPVRRAQKPKRRKRFWFGMVFLLLLVGVAAVFFWIRSRVLASLPVLEGEIALQGLTQPVRIDRDEWGVPSIHAANQTDLARALGFLHAQDRFFQMDLLRRQAAGEQSELFGPPLVDSDKKMRLHRLAQVAAQVWDQCEPSIKQMVIAYADGVNQGLESLGDVPFEYVFLPMGPRPWDPKDSILVILSMAIQLQDESGIQEISLGVMHDVLPPEMFELFAPLGCHWDAPLVGEAFETAPIPGPEVFDLRKMDLPVRKRAHKAMDNPSSGIGSNNWAVAGSLTPYESGMLAGDMHLPIIVPNTWYRADLHWTDGDDPNLTHRATGVTLPGLPGLVVGSNGHVAWTFTNSYGDWGDVIILEPDPQSRDRYLTPDGPEEFQIHREEIKVSKGENVIYEVKWTRWGPVIREDHRGRKVVLNWTAHHPEAYNLDFFQVSQARNLDEILDQANRSGIPAQNFVAVDTAGNIGWTLAGRIPKREGFDGRVPTSWADGTRRWNGWLEPEAYPRIVNPENGRIWTANSRVVDGDMLRIIGDGSYLLGSRAKQIRDRLMAKDRHTEADSLAIQLDNESWLHEPWRRLLLEHLTEDAISANPGRAEMRRFVEAWNGRADVDSVGYRLIRTYRRFVHDDILQTILTPCIQAFPEFNTRNLEQAEGSVWALLQAEPQHLLHPKYESWDAWLMAVADRVLAFYSNRGEMAQMTWGKRNRAAYQHPFSLAWPFLGKWLDLPPDPLPGDFDLPRVATPGFGASQRMVVAPGHEDQGIFHMPGGQSGHPASPFFQAGHRAWVEGRATPFLPGAPIHTLTLDPAP